MEITELFKNINIKFLTHEIKVRYSVSFLTQIELNIKDDS